MLTQNETNQEMLFKQTLIYLNSQFKDRSPTEDELKATASKIRKLWEPLAPVTDEEFNKILTQLKEQTDIILDVGTYIKDPNTEHQSWLPAIKSEIEFKFWNRFKQHLEVNKNWNSRATQALSKVSEEILDLCGDPSQERFCIKGLVMGDIQAGKTLNYTAILNKAADAGYKVFIILAGIREDLRAQTQERLDNDLIGRRSKDLLDPDRNKHVRTKYIGVGLFDKNIRMESFTSTIKDFNKTTFDALDLDIKNIKSPAIFVIKKNKTILENLIKWLRNCSSDSAGIINLPMMMIDDEADNASINTNDPETNPTAINDNLRQIIKLFTKSTYLGITATPFANIFIDSDINDDLFPSDFIYVLSSPSNYIGAEKIFGNDPQYRNMLCKIDDKAFLECIKEGHDKTFKVKKLPDDLYEAAYYYLLTNAIRFLRGDSKQHMSMLVNISTFTEVQNQIVKILENWLTEVQDDVKNFSRLQPSKSEENYNIRRFHEIWDKYKLEQTCNTSWETICNKYLDKGVCPVVVKAVNSSTGPRSLNYSIYKKTGLKVIAVGGHSLSRGLTLEGLCVSYFHRNSKAYDSLMQMGRWFGYRPNYDDLVKIWMTGTQSDSFGHIELAAEDLKNQLITMRVSNLTPREFGLKVRQAPGALEITQRNKMRTGTEFTIPVSISGNLIETPRLRANLGSLLNNEREFKNFINKLDTTGIEVSNDEISKGNYFWKQVPGELVANLIEMFDTHPWHLGFNSKGIADFIRKNWNTGWDVVLINKGEGDRYPDLISSGHHRLSINNTEKRNISFDKEAQMLSVSKTKLRVGSGGCTRIGLPEDKIKSIATEFKKRTGKKNVPDSAYLIKDRNPLLMLHIIEAIYETNTEIIYPKYLFALGVGFPQDSKITKTARYVVNMVQLKALTDIPQENFSY